MKNKIIGIYKITSPSKKVYIGQSNDIVRRWKQYSKELCKSQTYLYRSIKKYGYKKHKFEVIEECLLEYLCEKEKYYVDLYQSFNSKFGLNLRDGGGSKGKLSEETKRKIGLANKGINSFMFGKTGENHPNWGKSVSEETRNKLREINIGKIAKEKHHFWGRKRTEEDKKKISEATMGCKNHNFGKKKSDETKIKMSLSQIGKVQSLESRKKMSESKKKMSPETRKKMSDAKKGKKGNHTGILHSKETRDKLRASHLGKYQSKETIEKQIASRKILHEEKKMMIF